MNVPDKGRFGVWPGCLLTTGLVALGLVIGAAQGGAPLAFALAGLVYIMIGLAFTELASSYPVAGGGHYYSLRGLVWSPWLF